MILILILISVLTALDQFSKYLALKMLKPVGNVTVIKNWLDLTFVENRGAAFGILEGQRWFFVVMTVIVTIAAFIYFLKIKNEKGAYNWLKFSMVLILAGAWGNCIDRILRGYVVDYFEFTFINYPVFNVADIYVVAGTILMAVLIIFVIKDDEQTEKE